MCDDIDMYVSVWLYVHLWPYVGVCLYLYVCVCVNICPKSTLLHLMMCRCCLSMGSIKDPHAFLFDWDAGQYADTKLANVLFTYESQRRLAPLGITVRVLHVSDACLMLLCLHPAQQNYHCKPIFLFSDHHQHGHPSLLLLTIVCTCC